MKKQLQPGDVITMKIVAAGSGTGMPVFVSPAYVMKNNVKIYEAKSSDSVIGTIKQNQSPTKTLADINVTRSGSATRKSNSEMQFLEKVNLKVGDVEITADYVRIDDNKKLLFASGRINPKTSSYSGSPIAKMGKTSNEVVCDSLLMNYETMTTKMWNSKGSVLK